MSNLSSIEKLIGSVFIGGSNKVFSEIQSFSSENYSTEKESEINKIKAKRELSKSQWESRKKFINKIELLANKILTQTKDSRIYNRPSAFEQLSELFVTFDENMNILEYNKSFASKFLNGVRHLKDKSIIDIDNNSIVNNLDNTIEIDTIRVYGKPFEYKKIFLCEIKGVHYRVKTTPIYNNLGEFSYFIRMYTEI